MITKDNEKIYLGSFKEEADAAMAWNEWVVDNLNEEDFAFITLNEYKEEV
jgi:hypothetical protein